MIHSFPDIEKNVEKILNDLKKIDLGKLKDHLEHLENLINQKADRVELGPIKDDINQLKDLFKKLQGEIGSLRTLIMSNQGNGNGGGETLIELITWIEKIEQWLDALEKKLGNLARDWGSH